MHECWCSESSPANLLSWPIASILHKFLHACYWSPQPIHQISLISHSCADLNGFGILPLPTTLQFSHNGELITSRWSAVFVACCCSCCSALLWRFLPVAVIFVCFRCHERATVCIYLRQTINQRSPFVKQACADLSRWHTTFNSLSLLFEYLNWILWTAVLKLTSFYSFYAFFEQGQSLRQLAGKLAFLILSGNNEAYLRWVVCII